MSGSPGAAVDSSSGRRARSQRASGVAPNSWERFVAGEDVGPEVRPEILASWLRCRDEYKVDPFLEQAPSAFDEKGAGALSDGVVLAELGGIAKSIEAQAEEWGGLAAVADGRGRILASWGESRALHGAHERNLAPWSMWSEDKTGTNGFGTALEHSTATLVAQSEHWCAGFHAWTCAGIAIRDPVTSQPLGVLDISVHERPVPATVLGWLRDAVAPVEAELQRQANRSLSELLSVFATYERTARGLLVAADAGGRLAAANEEGRRVLGLSESDLSTATAVRRVEPESAELKQLILRAIERAHADSLWIGSAAVSMPSTETELAVTFRPVCLEGRVVGVLITSSGPEGEQLAAAAAPPASGVTRILGLRAHRLVLLAPEEIRFAQADGNTVWISTDQGRLRAFARGLGALEERVEGHGYLRVNRNFLVNLNRVREVAPAFKGGFALVMDGSPEEVVPVSRRHVAELRRILGL